MSITENPYLGLLLEKVKAVNPIEDGDYQVEGLWYCGKCRTPKQLRIPYEGEVFCPMTECQCKRERREADKRAFNERQEADRREQRRRECFPEVKMRGWTFDKDDRKNAEKTHTAQGYVENFPEFLKAGKGLLFFGSVGVGKSFLAACICNALIDNGYTAYMTNLSRLDKQIFSAKDKQEVIDGLERFDLLVIDDFGIERQTDYMNENVYAVIEARRGSGLPMILTTNLTAEQLSAGQDEVKNRIMSRLKEVCIPIQFTGQDRRAKKLTEDYQRLKGLLNL